MASRFLAIGDDVFDGAIRHHLSVTALQQVSSPSPGLAQASPDIRADLVGRPARQDVVRAHVPHQDQLAAKPFPDLADIHAGRWVHRVDAVESALDCVVEHLRDVAVRMPDCLDARGFQRRDDLFHPGEELLLQQLTRDHQAGLERHILAALNDRCKAVTRDDLVPHHGMFNPAVPEAPERGDVFLHGTGHDREGPCVVPRQESAPS